MELKDIALHSFKDAQSALTQALDGLSDQDIMWQPRPGANHIAFILWHMTRVEDSFVQSFFQRTPQVWETGKWHEKLNLPSDPRAVGFGYTAEQVDSFPHVRLRDLVDYQSAVGAKTAVYLESATAATFDQPVQSRIFGQTTTGALIAHLVVELSEHVGQIGYLKGLINSASV